VRFQTGLAEPTKDGGVKAAMPSCLQHSTDLGDGNPIHKCKKASFYLFIKEGTNDDATPS